METLLKCSQPALAVGSDHLIELVDRVIERHLHKAAPDPAANYSPGSVAICCGQLKPALAKGLNDCCPEEVGRTFSQNGSDYRSVPPSLSIM
jgi:hypothetical protein